MVTKRLRRSLSRLLRAPLGSFRFDEYSQNGEDGVIEELFRRLGIVGGWLVEFGAWNGVHLSNTYRLVARSAAYRAVYIEGDPGRFEALRTTAAAHADRIFPIRAYVQPSGEFALDSLLKTTPITHDFELLSIDVDGPDYQIWQGLRDYSPKVVVIEINSSLGPGREQIHQAGMQGTSFRSMLDLGKSKGYACVCHTGNLFFVQNRLLPWVRLGAEYLSNPQLLFQTDRSLVARTDT